MSRRGPAAGIRPLDFVLVGALALFCFLSFGQMVDVQHTGGSSIALLNGHILDFYDYNEALGLNDSYMISTYLLYAVWNIPVRLFGIVKTPTMEAGWLLTAWYRLLPVLFYLASAVVIYRICTEMQFSKRKARLAAYLFAASPVAIYSQFIFGQYDSFTVFFMLLGIYAYVKEEDRKFILFFAVSATFKYFTLAVFVPLLLLREKNILRAAAKTLVCMAPLALIVLVYWHSAAFQEYVLGFSVLDYLLAGSGAEQVAGGIAMSAAAIRIPWNLLIAAVICLTALIIRPADRAERMNWALFLCSMMMFAVFGFMFWHPQWLLLAVPFWALGTVSNKRPALLIAGDLVFMLLFVMYVCNTWYQELDQALLANGVFAPIAAGQIGQKLMMKDLFVFENTTVLKLGLSCGMFVLAALRHPAFCLKSPEMDQTKSVWPVRLSCFVGTGLFVVPALVCLLVAARPPYCTLYPERLKGHLPGICSEFQLSQTFVAYSDEVEYIEFYAYDWDRANTATLQADIVDEETGAVIASQQWDTAGFANRAWVRMDVSGAQWRAGGHYRIDFTSPDGTPENSVTVYEAGDAGVTDEIYAVLNGVPQDFTLCVKVFEAQRPPN